jgi:hypothetical protein
MKAAPTPTIDVNGLVTWVNDPTCTGGYFLFGCFDNGMENWYDGNSTTAGIGLTFYDAFAGGWQGGQRAALVGIDGSGNVVTNPTLSVGYLTKNL